MKKNIKLNYKNLHHSEVNENYKKQVRHNKIINIDIEKKKSNKVQDPFTIALSHFTQKKYWAAINIINEITSDNSIIVEALTIRGAAYFKLGDFELANLDLTTHLDIKKLFKKICAC
jgi:hypothetical protein